MLRSVVLSVLLLGSAPATAVVGVSSAGVPAASEPASAPTPIAPEAAAPAAAAPAPAAAASAAPAAPTLRLPGDVRPRSYDLELTLDPAAETFSGTVTIQLEVVRAAALLWLNATAIEVDKAEITASGRRETPRIVPGGEDFLGFELPRPLPPGQAVIRLRFRGRVQATDTHGLFRQKEGEDWYLFSQFEHTYARRAFPCFDEPAYKAPWRVTLRVPARLVAASNTRILEERSEGTDSKRVRFAETKPLPSYLVAVVVGPFDVRSAGRIGRNRVPFRILTPRGRMAESREAAAMTPEIFERIERYFDIPYPYDKLDEVAIPQTVGFGAMENAGLITYSMTGLLTEELSVAQRRRMAGTTAHEVAHQWFGDLVTMSWWDDIWLNEAFASWLGPKVVAEWRPDWDHGVAPVRSRSGAMSADSLITARRIRQPIQDVGDIVNAFDGITYAKGASILGMFERWIGPERFRAGIRRYLRGHAFGNATSDDFLAAVAAESTPEASRAFSTFLDQPGAPLVSVALACGPDGPARVLLRQRRFLPLGSKGVAEATWKLPVCVRYPRGSDEARACTLLAGVEGELALDPLAGCPSWILANDGEAGYYRASYGGGLLDRLFAGGGPRLTLPERVGLLDDVHALVRAGELKASDALGLVPRFAGETDRHILASLAGIAGGIRQHLVPPELRPNYRRFIGLTFGERARALGFTARPEDDEETRLLRETLVSLVADQGEDPVLRGEAGRLARRWLEDRKAVDPDMAGTVLSVAAIEGDRSLFDRLVEEGRGTKDRRDRRRILGALGSFRDPGVAESALALVLGEDFDIRESISILWSSFGDEATRERAYSFLKGNFDTLVARLPRESLPYLPSATRAFCDTEHRADVEVFFRERTASFSGSRRVLDQTLESIDLCVENRKAQQASVAAFLSAY